MWILGRMDIHGSTVVGRVLGTHWMVLYPTVLFHVLI